MSELPAGIPILLHGALSGPCGVAGETASVHPQCGHLFYWYTHTHNTIIHSFKFNHIIIGDVSFLWDRKELHLASDFHF